MNTVPSKSGSRGARSAGARSIDTEPETLEVFFGIVRDVSGARPWLTCGRATAIFQVARATSNTADGDAAAVEGQVISIGLLSSLVRAPSSTTMIDMPKGLDGVRVVCLESRRSNEIAVLVQKQGGIPIAAPSMQELALEQQSEALAFADVLSSGGCDLLLLLTGVGARMLFEVLDTQLGPERTHELLAALPIYCRGPKPLLVLKQRSLTPKGVAPEPNTSQQLLSLLAANEEVAAKRVYVQEYGRPSPELCDPLKKLGAQVMTLPVYGWGLPDDLEPLRNAVRALTAGEADAIIFTAAQQLEHLLLVADQLGCRNELVERLSTEIVIASIGPVTSEGLEQHGLRVDTTPEHPKMGQLVSHLARNWVALATKRSR